MLKTFLVARREFLAMVLTKGFLLGLLLPPLIATFGIALVPLMMNTAAPKTAGTIAVIDRSGEVANSIESELKPEAFKSRRAKKMDKAQAQMQAKGVNVPIDPRAKAASDAMAGTVTLSIEVLPAEQDVELAKKPILEARVRDGDRTSTSQRIGLLVIPDGAVRLPEASGDKPAEFEHYQLFVAPKLDIEVRDDIATQVDRAIVDARLRVANMDPLRVRMLSQEPITDVKVVTPEGERSDNGVATILLPIGFLGLLWISVFVGGQGLLASTIEEKSSRVMEVLLSAVSPMELMVGKIVGQMAVAGLILSLYATTGIGALVVFQMGHQLDALLLVCMPIYFVIAFFLIASMMAAIGSAVNDVREAGALMQPIMLVLIIPMVLWMPISRNPNGPFALVCSFLPPISPFVMVVRLAGSEPIPFWQVPATIAIGAVAMAFMAWATAKIFRIGVLMYGKPPNLKTLVKWVRMA